MSQKGNTTCVTREEFFGESFADNVKKKKSNNEKVSVKLMLTNSFDEWDIESYVKRINELNIDELIIGVSENSSDKPRYKQIKEVNDALHHFACFISASEEKGYQEFSYNGTKVIFEHYFK